jgi:hypothetical protein
MGEPTPEPRPRVDCTRFFDHLYFCYTPTWQLTQLYRRGELDSCEGAFRDWWDCLLHKAKPNPEVEVRREAAQLQASASRRKIAAGARRGALLPCAVP